MKKFQVTQKTDKKGNINGTQKTREGLCQKTAELQRLPRERRENVN